MMFDLSLKHNIDVQQDKDFDIRIDLYVPEWTLPNIAKLSFQKEQKRPGGKMSETHRAEENFGFAMR